MCYAGKKVGDCVLKKLQSQSQLRTLCQEILFRLQNRMIGELITQLPFLLNFGKGHPKHSANISPINRAEAGVTGLYSVTTSHGNNTIIIRATYIHRPITLIGITVFFELGFIKIEL